MLQIVWWKVEAKGQVPVDLYKDYCEIALYHINKARKPSVESKEISEEMLVPFPFIEAKKFGNKMALYARLQVIVVTFFFKFIENGILLASHLEMRQDFPAFRNGWEKNSV